MRRITLFAFLCALFLMNNQAFAQATACDNVTAPEVQTGMNSYAIGGTIWTPAPPMDQAAVNLPTTEYLIVKVGTCALDSARTACDTVGGGVASDVIIGGDDDGIFNPLYKLHVFSIGDFGFIHPKGTQGHRLRWIVIGSNNIFI